MRRARAARVLGGFALAAAAQSALAGAGGAAGTASVVAASLWMGPMFPTIFGITLAPLHAADVELGSAGLVMAVVGGAAITPLTAAVADGASLRLAYASVPTACFLLVALFAARHARGAGGHGDAQQLIGGGKPRSDQPAPQTQSAL